MVKVVVDTGVLAESFWDGPSRGVIELWKSGEITLCVSQPILREYAAVISRMGASAREREEFIGVFSRNPRVFTAGSARRVDVVGEEPAGDMLIDCAVAGGADFIITTDCRLLDLESYRGIAVAPPGEFLKAYWVGYRH
ncbi:MAG: putative toxin-antitoxin system toxin component, PIN family [bacterium]